MKILHKITSVCILGMLIAGCSITPKTPSIDQNLPTVKEVRSLSGINEIGLEWVPVHQENILGYRIYRSSNNNGKFSLVTTIDDRYSSHYTDMKVKPNTTYNYTMSTYSKSGFESTKSPITTIKTKPRPEAVGFVQAITNLPKRVKVIWRPHPYPNIVSYVIQKREIGKERWDDEKEVKGRLSAEYIDKGLDNNEAFEYRVMAKTDHGVLSVPSQAVSAKTKALPLSVQNVVASNNIPKKITLTWDKVPNKDILYYKIYSSPTSMLLYSYIAKTKQTKYEDLLNSNGTAKFYKVTAVDKDGLESAKQENGVQGQTLPAPKAPSLIDLRASDSSINLKWLTNDNRAVSFTVIKEHNGQKELIDGITRTNYTDRSVASGGTYSYSVIAIDKYGIKSKESKRLDTKAQGSAQDYPASNTQSQQQSPTQNINNQEEEIILDTSKMNSAQPSTPKNDNAVEIY